MRPGSVCRHLKIAGRVPIWRFFHVTSQQPRKVATHPSAPHKHVARRASEPHDSHGNPALHALDECVFKEAGQSQSRLRSALRVLQFLPDTPKPSRHVSDGSRADRSHMGTRGTARLNTRMIIANVNIKHRLRGFFGHLRGCESLGGMNPSAMITPPSSKSRSVNFYQLSNGDHKCAFLWRFLNDSPFTGPKLTPIAHLCRIVSNASLGHYPAF